MPASKVRNKAKKRIAAERKRLREQDSPCADSCCPRDVAALAARMPRRLSSGPEPARGFSALTSTDLQIKLP
jgi:hypothetical protein